MSYGLELNKKPLVFTMPRTPRDFYGLGDNKNIIDLYWMGRVVQKGRAFWGFYEFKDRDLSLATYIKIAPGVEFNFRASLHDDGWFRLDHFTMMADHLIVEPLLTSAEKGSSDLYGLSVDGRYLESQDLVLQKAHSIKINSQNVSALQSYLEGNYILINPFMEYLRDNFELGRRGKIPSMRFWLSYRIDRYNRAFFEFNSHGLAAREIHLRWLSFEGSNL